MRLSYLSDETKAILGYEFSRAVAKHGPTFKTLEQGIYALNSELGEVMEAKRRNDIDGRHGVRREVAQVAVVCLKILESLHGVTA
jgi:NTP pyrophosphatase (non-canonical NTP hydrolase)